MIKRWGFIYFIIINVIFTSTMYAAFLESVNRKDSSRLTFNWDKQPEYTLSQEGDKVTITFNENHKINKSDIEAKLPKDRIKLSGITEDDEKLTISFQFVKPGYAQTLNKGNQVLIDFLFDDLKNSSAKDPQSDKKVKKAAQTTKTTEKTPPTSEQPKTAKSDAIPIIIDEDDGSFKLVFDFTKPVKAGAFIEGNDLWLFFDHPVQFSWDEKKLSSSKVISKIQTFKNDRMSALQLDLFEEPETTSFYQRDQRWILLWPDTRDIKAPQLQTHIVFDEATGQSEMRFPKLDFGEPIFADMPGTGHPRYFIATSGQPIKVSSQYMSLDYYMLPTLQGVLIDPLSQDLSVKIEGNDIVISKMGGLNVSPPHDRNDKRSRYTPPSLLSFDGWSSKHEKIEQAIREFEESIISTPKNLRTPKRLKLIRYYLASGREYEALGLLNAAASYDPSLEKSPYFYSLRGLAYFMAGQYDKAHDDFTNPIISYEQEMSYWAEISKAAIDPLNIQYAQLAQGLEFLNKYPQRVKNILLLNMFNAAIYQKENTDVLSELISADKLTAIQKEEYEYLQTLNLINNGDMANVSSRLADNIQKMRTKYKYMSELLLAEIYAKESKLTPQDELKKLDKLLYRWSGDRFEYSLWKRMSTLYQNADQPYQALRYLSKAIRHYPRFAHQDDLEEHAENLFMKTITDDSQEILSKIAIYKDYPGFIPEDQRRFSVSSQLVQVLFEADLVEPAMSLMDQLINDPALPDNQKFNARLDYAAMALTHRAPKKALEYTNLPADIITDDTQKQSLRKVRAQAYLLLGDTENVRKTLGDDSSNEAFDMLAQCYFINKDWEGLVQESKERIHADEVNKRPIEPRQLIWLAMGYLLSGDSGALLNLHAKYQKNMNNKNEKELFDLLASTDPIDFTSTQSIQEQLLAGKRLKDIAINLRKDTRKS